MEEGATRPTSPSKRVSLLAVPRITFFTYRVIEHTPSPYLSLPLKNTVTWQNTITESNFIP
jgi:hypothetical protein